jgi:Flp pilus assembly protein TadD
MRYFWWRTLAASLLAMTFASGAAAEWRRAESANFVLYSQSGESKLREQSALLEDYHLFLRALTGVTDPASPNKLNVYMVRSEAQLRSIHNIPSGIGGVYVASSAGIAAIVNEASAGGGQETLLHEVAHHFMRQYRPLPYPAWYVEGFAEYASTVSFKKDAIEYGRPSVGRAYTLVQGKWLPLDDILFGGVPADRERMSAFYAQSWLLSHYLLRSAEMRPRFAAYLTAAARGETPRQAFATGFATPVADLERSLRSYSKSAMSYTRFKRASEASPPAVAVTRLPPSADDLLLLRATMEIRPQDEAGLLAKVRAAASKHDDEFARRVLAQAEALHGDPPKADSLLGSLLAARPDDAELLYFKGMRHLRVARDSADGEAEYRLARTSFARAHKANPNHWQTLLRYAEALRADERFVSDNTINILLLASELAPQTQEGTMNAAQLLITRKRWEEAERLLLPLTGDPHNRGLAEAARGLLEAARARGRPAVRGAEPAKDNPAAKE